MLRQRFADRGIATMPPRNIKQATLIPSARAIPNPIPLVEPVTKAVFPLSICKSP